MIGNPNNLRREQFRIAQAANEQAAREREIERLSKLTTKPYVRRPSPAPPFRRSPMGMYRVQAA